MKFFILACLLVMSACTTAQKVKDPHQFVKEHAVIQTDLLFEKKDLNRDGVAELFLSPQEMCGTGGCPWYIFEKKEQEKYHVFLGEIFGGFNTLILVPNPKATYSTLRIYHHMSADSGIVVDYEFKENQYEEVFSKEITNKEFQEFFPK